MSAFRQQLPALTGVVIGAPGSFPAIVRGDRARFRREQTERWEERRPSVYADHARCLERTVTLTYRVVAPLGNGREAYDAAVRADPALSTDRPVACAPARTRRRGAVAYGEVRGVARAAEARGCQR